MKIVAAAALCLLITISAAAQDQDKDAQNPPVTPPEPAAGQTAGQTAPPVHAAAITYSDGYLLRAKIHKYTSFATLPLFATEVALGQSIYNDPTNAESRKGAHIAVGTGIIGLFGVNAVTGVWNMVEDRHNPEGHKLRLIHGLLMLTANVGFVATAATGPHREDDRRFATAPSESDKALHRGLAIGSMAVGTVGYTIMLFGHR